MAHAELGSLEVAAMTPLSGAWWGVGAQILQTFVDGRVAISATTYQSHRLLGRLGEEWVVDFEKRRLHNDAKRPDLARRVDWIADTRGDGAGYDVASFDGDESPRLIEVKTTGCGKQFPFLVTSNEVRVSQREATRYHLYRVFEFAKDPRMYILRGALSEMCRLEPTQYRARLGGDGIELGFDED